MNGQNLKDNLNHELSLLIVNEIESEKDSLDDQVRRSIEPTVGNIVDCQEENFKKNFESNDNINQCDVNITTIPKLIEDFEIQKFRNTLSVTRFKNRVNILNEFIFEESFEKRLLFKNSNKEFLTKLWKENIVEILVEKNDPFVYEKFNQRFNRLKQIYLTTTTSCDRDAKIEDFEEWCKDKDIVNIFKFMKSLNKQIKLKIETEKNLKNEFEERKNIEIKFKKIFKIESYEFNQICENIKTKITRKSQVLSF